MQPKRQTSVSRIARNKPSQSPAKNLWIKHVAISVAAIVLLAACGGGGGGDKSTEKEGNGEQQVGSVYAPSSQLAKICVSPGTGEKQGTVDDEKAWVRSFVDERYLWYKDVPKLDAKNYASAELYFDDLKTPAKNSAGEDLDRFHWSEAIATTQQWQSGVSVDYGIGWRLKSRDTPRVFVVYDVEPLSPAGLAGIQRGDKLLAVDGVDFVNTKDDREKTIVDAALNPQNSTEHKFSFDRAGTTVTFTIAAGESFPTAPVRYKKVISNQGKKVAYLFFDSFIAKSQEPLIDAFSYFVQQGATDLVLDLRYNGGGLVYGASQLAYMIAGSYSANKIFSKDVYNDKRAAETAKSAIPFVGSYIDWDQGRYDTTRPLPTLNLKKVTIVTTGNTASASEALINSLRGIDVDVTLIGKTSLGKPYGFVPEPNCGRTYYAVEFKGANAKDFSDFDAGFAPTCPVEDDLNHALGDPSEANFSAALNYISTSRCSVNALSRKTARQEAAPVYTNGPARMILTPWLGK